MTVAARAPVSAAVRYDLPMVGKQNREHRRAARRRKRRRKEERRTGPAPFNTTRFFDRAIFLWTPIVVGIITIIVTIIFVSR